MIKALPITHCNTSVNMNKPKNSSARSLHYNIHLCGKDFEFHSFLNCILGMKEIVEVNHICLHISSCENPVSRSVLFTLGQSNKFSTANFPTVLLPCKSMAVGSLSSMGCLY